MQVAMLGPLEARDGAGSPREVSGTRPRAGQVVPASWLIGEQSGERLPVDAANALQARLSRQRDSGRVTAAVRALLAPADYDAAFSAGWESPRRRSRERSGRSRAGKR